MANFLAACLTFGGVAFGRAANSTASVAQVELCVQAGTRELLMPSLHDCAPLSRGTTAVESPLRRPRKPLLVASSGSPVLVIAARSSTQTNPASDPVETGTAGSPAGPGGPVGLSCSTGAARAILAGILIATSGSASPNAAAESSTTDTSPPAATVNRTTVQAVSVATLGARPGVLGHPVYWAGPGQQRRTN